MSYFENVYKSLLQSIKDNYEIDDISDYIVIDASFLLDSFCHIKLESKKCLGIFTQMYNDSQMGFYSVHHRGLSLSKTGNNILSLRYRFTGKLVIFAPASK